MYKIKKGMKITVMIFIMTCMSFLNFTNAVAATNLDTANIQSLGDCGQLLKYKGSIVITYYAGYIPCILFGQNKKWCL